MRNYRVMLITMLFMPRDRASVTLHGYWLTVFVDHIVSGATTTTSNQIKQDKRTTNVSPLQLVEEDDGVLQLYIYIYIKSLQHFPRLYH